MPRALVISVRFHDPRYHGSGPWPPAPARLFQALVAAAAEGATIPEDRAAALAWLEALAPPVILAPPARAGQDFRSYVPNNDLDAKGGRIERLAEIRAAKRIRPYLFEAERPLAYVWSFDTDPDGHAGTIVAIAERLYQLGRGVDMAWATAEVVAAEEAEERLAAGGGGLHHPTRAGPGRPALPCPVPGSLESLIDRHHRTRRRLTFHRREKKTQILFTQPPKPLFREVPYDAPPARLLFDLRRLDKPDRFRPWPLTRTVQLVEMVRDAAVERLIASLGEGARALIDRVFGRVRDMREADKASRIRITPLPSIGHAHAAPAIRRILVEIPPNCPLRREDIAWAFAGLHLGSDPASGEIADETLPILLPADDRRMLAHYGIEGTSPARRSWRSITALALPESVARRRIDPGQLAAERGRPAAERRAVKTAAQRAREEAAAARAVRQALRHAGVRAGIESIRVQREPFTTRGERAVAFAEGTRFSKHRLWHVEITFTEPVHGPLVLGDGRYLGLGLMAPVRDRTLRIASFAIETDGPLPVMVARRSVLHALRRALMALDRELNGEPLSRLFSGHDPDGRPAGARDGDHRHVFLIAEPDPGEAAARGDDAPIRLLHVIRPDGGDRSLAIDPRDARRFEAVVSQLELLRAGEHGLLRLVTLGEGAGRAPLFGRARCWRTLTPYVATRHPKKGEDRYAFLKADIAAELARRGFPAPREIAIEAPRFTAAGDLVCDARVRFKLAVEGPLLLGRLSHRGEGAFAGES